VSPTGPGGSPQSVAGVTQGMAPTPAPQQLDQAGMPMSGTATRTNGGAEAR
jgi:hypothetical protein